MAYLEPGIYTNIFPVKVPEDEILVVKAPRSEFQDLRPLRYHLEEVGKNVWVYSVRDIVYGYGPDAPYLESKGFQRSSLRLPEVPRLATHMIVEGLVNVLKHEGYQILSRKGRLQAYYPKEFTWAVKGWVKVYREYDLRSLFWKDIHTNRVAFGLIVDIFWALRDDKNQPLSMRQIRQKYGYNATIAIGQVQGEYLPRSNRLNTEVARQRFHEHILPFVQNHSQFNLPCGGRARLLPEPVRVIIGGEEQ